MAKRQGVPFRRRPRLEPRKRLLILCEGKVTEPSYLKSFRQQHRNPLVHIEVVPDCGVPKTLVEIAVSRVKESQRQARRFGDPYLKYDEVWCVFDVDSHPNLPEAKKRAQDHELELAISNPCFELWLLLHFQDQRAEQDRWHIQAACRRHIPAYEKEIPYSTVEAHYTTALTRATALDRWQQGQGRPGGNPSTTVYRLLERIAELGKDSLLRKTIS